MTKVKKISKSLLVFVLAMILLMPMLFCGCDNIFSKKGEEYNITVQANSHGRVAGSGLYKEGQQTQISAIADEGYKFLNWNDGNTENPRTIMVSGTKIYTASFSTISVVDNSYTVSLSQKTGGKVYGEGTYKGNTYVTLNAVADDGYVFVKWSDGNKDASRALLISSNKSLSATFIKGTDIKWFGNYYIVMNGGTIKVEGNIISFITTNPASGVAKLKVEKVNSNFTYEGNTTETLNASTISDNYIVSPLYWSGFLAMSCNFSDYDSGGGRTSVVPSNSNKYTDLLEKNSSRSHLTFKSHAVNCYQTIGGVTFSKEDLEIQYSSATKYIRIWRVYVDKNGKDTFVLYDSVKYENIQSTQYLQVSIYTETIVNSFYIYFKQVV